jgi:D-alanine-D-alanine ligase
MVKQKVGLLFGGCSGEHEVSITSARAIASALQQGDNQAKYEILPVYIDKSGAWQSSNLAQQVLESGKPLLLEAEPENLSNDLFFLLLWWFFCFTLRRFD